MAKRPATSTPRAEPWRWWLATFGCAVAANLVLLWDVVGTTPDWALVIALVAIGLGMVCFAVATVLSARAEGVGAWRLIGRMLWAPIRFLLDFTF